MTFIKMLPRGVNYPQIINTSHVVHARIGSGSSDIGGVAKHCIKIRFAEGAGEQEFYMIGSNGEAIYTLEEIQEAGGPSGVISTLHRILNGEDLT